MSAVRPQDVYIAVFTRVKGWAREHGIGREAVRHLLVALTTIHNEKFYRRIARPLLDEFDAQWRSEDD